MTGPSWRFRRMHPGEMNIDPIEAEFFSTEALGSLSDALIRESIQNSLDARRPDEQLRFRVSFPAAEALLRDERRELYLAGLRSHVYASRVGLNAAILPAPDEPLSFIVLEDFGTRGLQGDPAQSEDADNDPQDGPRNDFFFFWRNVGRSRKHASELGRWGLGKTVFQAASRINSFFALTLRANDRRQLLLGQSVLKIHKLDGERFYPYGYYGAFENDFALPIEAPDAVADFERDFGLDRGANPGTSVVLPYPDASLTPRAIVDSVVRHYFMPILGGRLVVEIVDGAQIDRLDTQSLVERFTRIESAEGAALVRVFELARWAMHLPRDEHTLLRGAAENMAPRWDDACFGDDALQRLRQAFQDGGRIAVSAPVWVKPEGANPILSRFDVYLERDETLDRADDHFVRDGITVTGVRSGLPKGIRALVLIRDRALSSLVGDSENPAHTEWQERSPKFKDKYRHGVFTLRYIKSVPRELVRLLTRPSEQRDFALLRQLFSVDMPTEAEVVHRAVDPKKPGTGEEIDPAAPETIGRDTQFVLQKLRGGFRVRGRGEGSVPPRVVVTAAYEVRRGSPFRHYHSLDFDLAKPPIDVVAKGAVVAARQGNVLVLDPQTRDFELSVRGFDPHRDLRVKVLPAREAAT
jgi:hypothetical protein